MPRRQIGLSDAEIADARRISTLPSQSISRSAPTDMYTVSITEPVGDKGDKTMRDVIIPEGEDGSENK